MITPGARLLLLVLTFTGYQTVTGRAIMVEPPHRSSLWRFNFSTPVNLRDDSINCGGYDWQYNVHQGRCGVCGDRWNGTQDNADGGKFDSGIVPRHYKEGHYINITFEVSSNYLGYVEFRLCPRNSTLRVLDQSCFDRYPLWIDESHGTRYYIGSRGGIYDLHIRLPAGLLCKRCVLQWKYKTGYRYNGDDSCKCQGCGQQEQYVNCADIGVTPREGWASVRHETVGHLVDHHTDPRHDNTAGRQRTHGRVRPRQTSRPDGLITTRPALTSPAVNISMLITANPLDDLHFNAVNNVQNVLPPTAVPNATSQSVITNSSKFVTSTSVAFPVHSTPSPDTLEVIRREIIKRLGNDVTRDVNTGVRVSVLPEPPVVRPERRRADAFHRPLVSPVSDRPPPIRQRNGNQPNTQFVSVSSILNRFFLLSSSLGLPPGCDVNSDEFRCIGRGIYNQSPGVAHWCEINCRAQNCVSFMCECYCEDKRRSQNSSCHAIAGFKGVEGMDQWCTANCKVGYCPANTCSVEDCVRPGSLSNGEL